MTHTAPRLIPIRNVAAERTALGSLAVVQSNADLGFPIRRVFFIHGMDEGTERGGHAHKEGYQCLIMARGSSMIVLEGPAGRLEFMLERPDQGLIVPPEYWREMKNFSQDAVMLVLASDDYSEAEYIRNYDEFRLWSARRATTKQVPYIDFTRRLNALRLELEQTAAAVMKECRYIMGPRLERFEQDFAAFCGTEHCVGTGNGLDALELILRALGVGQGDEVIMSAGGYIATPLAVLAVGAKPVFADCLPFGNIDPTRIEAVVTEKTRAVLLTHLYGLPADMDAIWDVAVRHGLKVIEDACQAHGSRYKGFPCGSLGHAAAFSFYPTKNLGGFGDGGCVTTNDEGLAETVRKLRNYGSCVKYYNELAGKNSRLDEMQAALLSVMLPYVEDWNARRRDLAGIYFAELGGESGLVLPEAGGHVVPNRHVFPVRVRDGKRDALADFLRGRGIGTNIHYPLAMHRQECLGDLGFKPGDFPVAEALAEEELSLPLDAFTSEDEVRCAAGVVREFFRR